MHVPFPRKIYGEECAAQVYTLACSILRRTPVVGRCVSNLVTFGPKVLSLRLEALLVLILRPKVLWWAPAFAADPPRFRSPKTCKFCGFVGRLAPKNLQVFGVWMMRSSAAEAGAHQRT